MTFVVVVDWLAAVADLRTRVLRRRCGCPWRTPAMASVGLARCSRSRSRARSGRAPIVPPCEGPLLQLLRRWCRCWCWCCLHCVEAGLLCLLYFFYKEHSFITVAAEHSVITFAAERSFWSQILSTVSLCFFRVPALCSIFTKGAGF